MYQATQNREQAGYGWLHQISLKLDKRVHAEYVETSVHRMLVNVAPSSSRKRKRGTEAEAEAEAEAYETH
ncbi:hypothetical protein FHL15_003018 [Xylaria flabelliformis]|uniref:Uncharacterized protein n=1 Tax=Xylaria flabelliformis TaxID=2512241 RepID=A0A553I7Y4_9PEZI|nr:hypothetical protein FHL15_003018 [Xylaria flabelliformis]